MTEIRTDDRDFPRGRTIISKSQVPRTGAQIQNRRVAVRWNQAGRSPAPILVDIHAQQVVEQVITRRNVAEHSPNACLTLVEQGNGQETLRPEFPSEWIDSGK